ncbi:unnamed protein product [Brassicogethes aeneus]|uniref:Daxx histone-binding domain-containing protein n=1 Tax=Brassicogethes aeneus TaxID=1431903 RepID=A0A9P0B1T9_BRAAE|nr:unnamed protein product [Brassicogethes aeneus]
MADNTITLSSDDECESAPKKIKPTPVIDSAVIELSDNEDSEKETSKNNVCDTVNLEDDDSKENKDTNDAKENNSPSPEEDKPTQSASEEQSTCSSLSSLEDHQGLNEFLTTCQEVTAGTQYDLQFKFTNMKKLFVKCGRDHASTDNFKRKLSEWTKRASGCSMEAACVFHEFYCYLKSMSNTGYEVESEEQRARLKKLEITIKALQKKIKEFEEQEVDFEEEENSSFMKLDLYTVRLNKVYKKYCELLKKNPYSGRKTYERLGFVQSEFVVVNQAINKKYKNSLKFPTYIEVENIIKKCVKENGLALSEGKIKTESESVFKNLGDILQTRRRKELYECHSLYIENVDDPAKESNDLDQMLKKNKKIAAEKIDEVVQSFVEKENIAKTKEEETKDESEDSDNSNYQDSEEELETVPITD